MTYIPQQLRITPIEGWERPRTDSFEQPTLKHKRDTANREGWFMWDSKLDKEEFFFSSTRIFKFFNVVKISSILKANPYRKRYFFSHDPFTAEKKENCLSTLIELKKPIGKSSEYRVLVRDIWGKVTLYESAGLAGEAMGGDKTAVYRIINHKKRNLDGFSAMREGDTIFPRVEFYKITKDGVEFRHCTMVRAYRAILKMKGKDLRTDTLIRWFNAAGYEVTKEEIN